MKPILFRFKIAFLSMLMSGVLVVGFALVSVAIVGRVGIARIDSEIRALGEAQVREPHPTDYWSSFDQSLHFIYGEQSAQRIAVRVIDKRGAVLFTSAQWPAALSGIEMPELQAPPDNAAPRSPVFPGRDIPGSMPDREETANESRHFVQRLDRDGDKRVSADEFDGPAEHFHEVDRDGDGYITASEFPAHMPAQLRETAGNPSDHPGMPRHAPGERGEFQSPGFPQTRPKVPVFSTWDTPAGAWRVGFIGNDSATLLIAADLATFRREATLLRNIFLLATPLALLILGVAGWVLAARALRPVGIITRTAKAITARDLHRRIPATGADAELQRLVDVINGMLERLERSFHQAARFSADAAHELQTPLTVLQGELDNAVQQAASGSEEQRRYSGLLEEVRSLKTVVQKLLLLARADVGKLPLSLGNVDLSAMIGTAVEDVEAMAPGMTVETDIAPDIHVAADVALIGQAIRNMSSNATKYGREGGTVQFKLRVGEDAVLFTLTNTGDPIPEEDRERIFNRFHRVDKARSRAIRGAGLGLSLAREIARAHGGDLVLDPYTEGTVSFTLTLPRGLDQNLSAGT